MLKNGPEIYRPHFRSFLAALAHGKRANEAWEIGFGEVEPAQLERDFRAWTGAAGTRSPIPPGARGAPVLARIQVETGRTSPDASVLADLAGRLAPVALTATELDAVARVQAGLEHPDDWRPNR